MRGLLKAGREVRRTVKAWKKDNPRRYGEKIKKYRARAKEGIEQDLNQRFKGDGKFLEILMEILKIILPLLI